ETHSACVHYVVPNQQPVGGTKQLNNNTTMLPPKGDSEL
ncbi:hypothetical protein J2X98_004392, partial [Pseudarthrobacter enclensis]|nr:hypothetical protein [Pseudarthrobacter enclensis]